MPYLGVTPSTAAGADLDGKELILDSDADTTITADTDDQIDIRIAGADDFQFTANTFTALSGSTVAIASGATIANSGTATGFADLTAVADGSVGSPSIANSGDTNTGIYWPGADQLGLTTAGAAGLLIDATGAVTKPLTPAFLAKSGSNVANVTGDGTVYTGVFGSERFDQNADFSTSTFTAPVTGRYYLHAYIYSYDMATDMTTWNVNLVTSNSTYAGTRYVSTTFDPSEYAAFSGLLVDMDASDTATITFQVSGGSLAVEFASNSHFGGWLVA